MKIYILLNKEKINKKTKYLIKEDSINMKVVEFCNDDYHYLDEEGYFDSMNIEIESLLNIYSYEKITCDKLDKLIKRTHHSIDSKKNERFTKLANKMIDCYKLALELKTLIVFYCEEASYDNLLHDLTED